MTRWAKVSSLFVVFFCLAAFVSADNALADRMTLETEKAGRDLSALTYFDEKGQQRTLVEHKGKVVLINLWARWCAPCVEELPTLTALDHEIESKDFVFLPISLDFNASPKEIESFLENHDIENVSLNLDYKMSASKVIGFRSMPTTVLVDRQSREIGRLARPADWSSDQAIELVKVALKQ